MTLQRSYRGYIGVYGEIIAIHKIWGSVVRVEGLGFEITSGHLQKELRQT